MGKLLHLTIATLLVAAQTAAAQGQTDTEPHRVRVEESSASHVVISSAPYTAEATERVTWTFDTRNATLAVSYGADVANTTLTTNLSTTYHQLVEYRDADGDGAFDHGEDVVSAWSLSASAGDKAEAGANGTVQWRDLVVENTNTTDGAHGVLVTARGVLDARGLLLPELPVAVQNATLALSLAVLDRAGTVAGVEAGPRAMGVRVTLENYTFAEADTRLALVAETAAEAPLARNGLMLTAASPLLPAGVATLSHGYAATAAVDGTERDVTWSGLAAAETTTAADGTDASVTYALSYHRGARLDHAGAVGAYATPPETDVAADDLLPVPTAGGLLAGAAVAGVALALGRKRSR